MKDKKKWFDPQTETGWRKTQKQETRLARLRKAHGGDLLAAARGINALANVTKDAATKRLARADAKKLFKLHKMKTAKATANPSKKRRVAEAGIGSAPIVLGILFFAGLIYLGKKSASE